MIKSVEDFKARLVGSLRLFVCVTIFALGLTILSQAFMVHVWVLAVTPTLLVMSFWGLAITAKQIIYLAECQDKLNEMSEDEFYSKFTTMDTIIRMFWFLVPAVFILLISIGLAFGVNLITISQTPASVGIAIIFCLIFVIRELSEELSFALFYVAVIKILARKAPEIDISVIRKDTDISNRK